MTKRKIERAGVIPYVIEDGKIIMMFMRPSDVEYGGDVLQISKGKVEEGEDVEVAAFREASEELGLFKGNVLESYKLGTFLGRTTIYVAKIKDKNMFGDPHFETSETKWLTLEQFQQEGRELHRHVVNAAIRLIRDKESL